MALSALTELVHNEPGSAQTVTATFLPVNGALLFLFLHGKDTAAPGVPTITDTNGSKWTGIGGGTFNSTNRLGVYWSVAPSASTITLSADWGAAILCSDIAVSQMTGQDTTTPIVAGSTAGATGTSTTPACGTVPSLSSTANVQLHVVATRAASSTGEGGWTEILDHANGAGACQLAVYTIGDPGDTTPTASIANAAWRAYGLEVAAAAPGGGGGSPAVTTGLTAAQRTALAWRRRR